MPPPRIPTAPSSSPEAVARATFQESLGTKPAEKRANEIRAKMQKDGPHETLVSLAEQKPVEAKPVEELNENNIGIETDPATGKKVRAAGSAEETRHIDVSDATKRAVEYMNLGYDKITNPVTQKLIRDEVERVMRLDPGTAAYLDKVIKGGGDIKTIIEGRLRDPEMRQKIREAFLEATDPTKKKLDQADMIRLSTVHKDAKATRGLKENEAKRKQDEVDEEQKQLDEFNDGSGGLAKGGKYSEMETLDTTRVNDIAEKRAREGTLATVKAQITSHENDRAMAIAAKDAVAAAKAQAEITKLNSDVIKLNGEITERGERIERRDRLEQTKKDLQEKMRRLQGEKDILDVEFGKSQSAELLAQADFEAAKLSRTSAEETYVNGIKNVFAEGATKYIDDKLQKSRAAERTLIEEEIERTGDPAEKAVLKATIERWKKEGKPFFGGKKIEHNKDQIQKDYETLMGIGPGTGPEALMRDMLRKAGFSSAEIDTKLKDPNFVSNMQSKVIESLLAQKIQIGSKISEADGQKIFDTWGKEMLDNAVAKNKEFRDYINKQKADGVIKGSIFEWYKRKSGGSILKLLLLLIGTASVVPILGIKLSEGLKS